jgi:hypothetical protein
MIMGIAKKPHPACLRTAGTLQSKESDKEGRTLVFVIFLLLGLAHGVRVDSHPSSSLNCN